ncbi:MAG: hypothetical protein N2Z79_02445, partial [Candidatus Omnitrophica bacterium]|nr:hypothetical protein [Candidatus Omnitrophota bacterium]
VYSLEKNDFMSLRNKILFLSQELKEELLESEDVVYLNGLWNSCVVGVLQIDAYLAMLGILSSTKEKVIPSEAIEYIKAWLERIRGTTQSNLKALDMPPQNLATKTQEYIQKLKSVFMELESLVSRELSRL